MKTILVPVYSNFFARNFLYTRAREIITGHGGIRLVLLVPSAKLQYYQKEFSAPAVVIDVLPGLERGRVEDFFSLVETSSIHTVTARMIHFWRLMRHASWPRFLSHLPRFAFCRICWRLGKYGWWRRAIRRAYASLPSATFAPILEKYRPDLVFCPTMLYDEPRLLKEAGLRRIRTAGMILSWDNLYSKTFLRVLPDHLIVQTDHIRAQAQRLADYPARRVSVVGVPQYDRHFNRDGIEPRESFLKKLGGDPRKKLIVYAFSGKPGFEIEWDIVGLLADAIRRGKVDGEVQVLLRPYPRYDFPVHKLEAIRGRYGFLVSQSAAHPESGPAGWDFDPDAMALAANTLAHADAIVNMFSTFFIEGAIFDKPLIGVAFDGASGRSYWNSAVRFFDWDHLRELKPLEGIRIVKSEGEFIEALNASLRSPGQLREGRQRIVAQQCQFTDGRSGERLAAALLAALESV